MGSFKKLLFSRIDDVSFRVYSDDEIESISKLHVTNENSLNALGHYLENGIYDPRLGPMSDRDDRCKTCFRFFYNCSGHCGHIDLPLPLFNPFFIDVIKNLLTRICPSCYRFQVKASRGIQFIYECMLCSNGFTHQSLDVSNIVSNFMLNSREAVEDDGRSNDMNHSTETLSNILSLERMLKKHLQKLKEEEGICEKYTSNTQAVHGSIQRQFLDDTRPHSSACCIYCKTSLLKLKFENSQIVILQKSQIKKSRSKSNSFSIESEQPFLTPKQAQQMIKKCYDQDGFVLKHLYPFLIKSELPHPTDLFFMNKVLVIPPRYRPLTALQNNLVENEISFIYKSVIKMSNCLRFMVQCKTEDISTMPDNIRFLLSEFKGSTQLEKSHLIWAKLQSVVDNLLDADIDPSSRICTRGIRQIVEKKFGLFRRNLMGKRVNFSARSVAAPDPLLAVDEVGVPLDFALKLTYPVAVTPWNVSVLRKLVERGPLNYPGALMVEDEEGSKITLKPQDTNQRIAIAKSLLTPAESCARKVNATKIVYRHLQSGDFVLMNRQPTLHKPSIQAHKARVMAKDRVLRLPYANCKAYNADFDGDELNMHFPQNEVARSESKFIMTTHNQYLTHKDGSPLAGLIQDCVVASVMLTVRGKFFDFEDYQQLVFIALDHLHVRKVRLLRPAIIKPKRLWSGKQIISTILINLIPESKAKPSFKYKTSVKSDFFVDRGTASSSLSDGKLEINEESEFVMSEGELLCGVVDKCAIGSTRFGLVHLCYDLYGGALASSLLTSVNRLCVAYLQWMGHTISLKEFVTTSSVDRRRRKALQKLIQSSEGEVAGRLGVESEDLSDYVGRIHRLQDEKELANLDSAYTAVLGPVTSNITKDNEKGLKYYGLKNRMRMMVDTGAKGSKVNMNQMASLFGSVALDGKRMSMSMSGKTLPSFKPYDCNPLAGGFIKSRFATGIEPRSYFFLCIVGRDSLQHTALKTANSGYMQRCLIKHLEGIKVEYDLTVRNSDGVVLQFDYGEDGMDVSKVPFLSNRETLDTLIRNRAAVVGCSGSPANQEQHSNEQQKKTNKQDPVGRVRLRRSGFLSFCSDFANTEEISCTPKESVPGRTSAAVQLYSKWRTLDEDRKKKYLKIDNKLKRQRAEVESRLTNKLGSVNALTEAMDSLVDQYLKEKGSSLNEGKHSLGTTKNQSNCPSKQSVMEVVEAKASRCRVEAGEAVGALCAQAIGEPLTQMTLNTFHFAGRDELNVTLGVPRMIEILRTASENIKTPIMEVPFKQHVTMSQANDLKMKLTPVPLHKVLHKITVTSCLAHDSQLKRHTEIHFDLLPQKEYKGTYYVKPRDVLRFLEYRFFKNLIKEVKAAIVKANLYANSVVHSSAKATGKDDDDMGDNDDLEAGSPAAAAAFGSLGNRELGDDGESSDEEQTNDVEIGNDTRATKAHERDYSEDEGEEQGIEDFSLKKEEEATEILPEDETVGGNGDTTELGGNGNTTVFGSTVKGRTPSEASANEYQRRLNYVTSQDSYISDYLFDQKKNLWCKVSLNLPIAEGRYDLSSIIRKVAEASLVYSVPGVKKAVVETKGDDSLVLRTEGANVSRMYMFESLLDINRIYTNNIHQMAQVYGIEAAQRSIIREIREVQSAYDIKVDFRHLSLLADYFTCEGVYKACSRFALDTCASPIQKMSYETCFQFMKKSLLQGLGDDMASPSARVMVGQPVDVGTNAMHILCRLGVAKT